EFNMGQISVEIYNPPGSTLSDNQHNEERIADLTRSLGDAALGLNHDYARSSLNGRSRIDFDRSR
ncbi:MAG: hypothetical protein AB7U35_11445, partial [Sphingobium sp.]